MTSPADRAALPFRSDPAVTLEGSALWHRVCNLIVMAPSYARQVSHCTEGLSLLGALAVYAEKLDKACDEASEQTTQVRKVHRNHLLKWRTHLRVRRLQHDTHIE